jgi:hypothetical protein
LSISIYYTVHRKAPLNSSEIAAVTERVTHYSVDEQIDKLLATGLGLNWESFDFTINSQPSSIFKKGNVFTGSTKLPDNQEEATWIGLQHWCKCLSDLRTILSSCDWHVQVEDHEIEWDAVLGAYDPSP